MDNVIVGIITNPLRNKVLLFKRASNKLYPNMWAPVSAGPYSPEEDFESKAIKELEIETGLRSKLVLIAPIMNINLDVGTYTLHPFLFEASETDPILLNEEHSEFKWEFLSELTNPQYDQRLQIIIKLIAMAPRQ